MQPTACVKPYRRAKASDFFSPQKKPNPTHQFDKDAYSRKSKVKDPMDKENRTSRKRSSRNHEENLKVLDCIENNANINSNFFQKNLIICL